MGVLPGPTGVTSFPGCHDIQAPARAVVLMVWSGRVALWSGQVGLTSAVSSTPLSADRRRREVVRETLVVSSCTWSELVVRAIFRVLSRLFDRRGVHHVHRQSTTASGGIERGGSSRGFHGCQDVLFGAWEARVHDILGVKSRQDFHTLSFFIKLFTRRMLNLVLVISVSVMMLNGIRRTITDLWLASNVSSYRAACGHQCLAASCDQAIACLTFVIHAQARHA